MSQWTAEVLGHGLVISADHPRLDALARAAFPAARLDPVARLRLTADGRPGPAQLFSGMHRYLLFSGGVGGVLDCTRWAATVRVGPEVLADAGAVRHLVVEAAALFQATAYDRVPVHASAIARDGRVILMVGPPGSGKSTLALLASRAGCHVLAEDVVYVQRRPRLTVRGIGRYVHLRPEVADRLGVGKIGRLVVRPGGLAKRAVPLGTAIVREGVPAGLVVLHRGDVPALEALPAAAAVRAVLANVPGGFGRFSAETAEVAPLLAAAGAWRLTFDDRPERATGVLDTLFSLSMRSSS